MKKKSNIRIPILLLIVSCWLPSWASRAGSPTILLIEVDDAIQPITSQFILQAIEQANQMKAELMILSLQTPGGLVTATEEVVDSMLRSETPILVFVEGTKAASAGFFITIASHVAVMAPGTRIGAAHPVSLVGSSQDDVMMEKIVNDLAAYVRTIAENRGRNVKLAEQAVRESRSFTEREALEGNLIDFICRDLDEILEKVDGRSLTTASGVEHVLRLEGAEIVRREMTVRQEILSVIANPAVSIFLLGIGALGLYLEFSHPGLILPGVLGGICLLLFALSVQIIPINFIGLLLILLGILLFILEIKVISYGMLTVGGLACFVLGSLVLFENPPGNLGIRVPTEIILAVSLTAGLLMAFLTYLVVSVHRRQIRTGHEGMHAETGLAITSIDPVGRVFIHGEYWNARSIRAIEKGRKIRVIEVINLEIQVEEVGSTPG